MESHIPLSKTIPIILSGTRHLSAGKLMFLELRDGSGVPPHALLQTVLAGPLVCQRCSQKTLVYANIFLSEFHKPCRIVLKTIRWCVCVGGHQGCPHDEARDLNVYLWCDQEEREGAWWCGTVCRLLRGHRFLARRYRKRCQPGTCF